MRKREGTLLEWMAYVRSIEIERLRSLSREERSEPFIHWKYTRTARKVMRRMLEHQWEHLVEIEERLGQCATNSIETPQKNQGSLMID